MTSHVLLPCMFPNWVDSTCRKERYPVSQSGKPKAVHLTCDYSVFYRQKCVKM